MMKDPENNGIQQPELSIVLPHCLNQDWLDYFAVEGWEFPIILLGFF